MRIAACFALAALLSLSTIVRAEEKEKITSGPQPGDSLEAFDVTKLAGAGNDNVEIGKKLCYRCLLGDRPVVMVFTSQLDLELANLITNLEKTVSDNGDKKLASFVNLMGKDSDILKQAAEAIVQHLNVKNIAIVMPEDPVNGPKEYKLNPAVATTVLIYREGKVRANYALPLGKLDEAVVKKIVADTKKMLN